MYVSFIASHFYPRHQLNLMLLSIINSNWCTTVAKLLSDSSWLNYNDNHISDNDSSSNNDTSKTDNNDKLMMIMILVKLIIMIIIVS